jgi:hypothetical protein
MILPCEETCYAFHMKKYTGGCHCKLVRYEVTTDLVETITCNCSHCSMKGFILTFVDTAAFTLLSGKEHLTEYLFNKKAIRHLFCNVCATESFGEGINFPKVAINVRCLDDIDLDSLAPKAVNGKDF